MPSVNLVQQLTLAAAGAYLIRLITTTRIKSREFSCISGQSR